MIHKHKCPQCFEPHTCGMDCTIDQETGLGAHSLCGDCETMLDGDLSPAERDLVELMSGLAGGLFGDDGLDAEEATRAFLWHLRRICEAGRGEEIKSAIATMMGIDASPRLQPAAPKPVCARHHDLCGCAAHACI